MAFCTNSAAKFEVKGFNGMCHIDDPPDLLGKCEEWDELWPCPTPVLTDSWISFPPETGLEGGQSLLGGYRVNCTGDD
jgi:hypothetical protein